MGKTKGKKHSVKAAPVEDLLPKIVEDEVFRALSTPRFSGDLLGPAEIFTALDVVRMRPGLTQLAVTTRSGAVKRFFVDVRMELMP